MLLDAQQAVARGAPEYVHRGGPVGACRLPKRRRRVRSAAAGCEGAAAAQSAQRRGRLACVRCEGASRRIASPPPPLRRPDERPEASKTSSTSASL